MLTLADVKPVHARWSEVNREFLDFVEQNPTYLDRSSFASIYEERSLRKLSIQPWPLFVGGEQRLEVEGIALGMDRLVKGALERLLANDPAEVVEFYRTNGTMDGSPSFAFNLSEELVGILQDEPNGLWGAPSRADYVETREGLKCIEFNAGGFLGGLQTDAIAELYLRSAPTARFLREHDRRARAPGTVRALFRHILEDTARTGIWDGGDFNVAMVVHPNDPDQAALHSAELYNRELQCVLDETGAAPGGEVFVCALDDFRQEGESITIDGRPVHAVVEQHNGKGDMRPLFRYFKMGFVNLFSGPIGGILGDKRNLALISEHASSDDFTAAERDLIEKHLPWTRRVKPGRTMFRGRPISLPDDLLERREELVLKKASSIGGRFVHVGKFHTGAEWRDFVTRARWEEDWVVQEYLETVPYWFQNGPAGATRHDMVWGLFAFGDHFGGAFLRMQAMGGGGVVNTYQGAEVGVLLEVAG